MGETMAVLMVCGNIVQYPHNPFEPARTLTANIALEMGYASGSHSDALFVSALILMLASIVIVWGSNRIQQSKESLQ
jgi:phosphate transport system permease protein